MFKRLGVSGAAVAIVALAVGIVGPALGSGGSNSEQHRTIQVISTNIEEDFVNVGPNAFSLGDAFIFTSKLTMDGEKIGHAGVVCTTTSTRSEGELQCVGTAWFDGRGQVAFQGLLKGEPQTFTIPITGGSGAYEGAEGELEVRQLAGVKEKLTFHLSN